MKKYNKKRIIISIILTIMLIMQIKAFKDSRANKLTTVTAKIVDTSGLLSDEILNIQAINEEKSGTVITLPSVVNDKKIEKYLIEKRNIQNSETDDSILQETDDLQYNNEISDTVTQNTFENEIQNNIIEETQNITNNIGTNEDNTNVIRKNEKKENIKENKKTEDITGKKEKEDKEQEKEITEDSTGKIENSEITEGITKSSIEEINNIKTTEEDTETVTEENEDSEVTKETEEDEIGKIEEKFPGEKVYLTKQELEEKEIVLNAVYDTREKNEQKLYNKVLELEKEEHKITLVGYMPDNAQIKAEKVEEEELVSKIQNHMNTTTVVRAAYDIKILVDDIEYEPNEFDEHIEVTIAGIEINEEEKYKVVHIDDSDNTEEVSEIELQEDRVKFKAKEFSTYAILSDVSTYAMVDVENVTSELYGFTPQNTWDGTSVATDFSFGDGTEERPYLIADAAELAYLAEQVNSGNTYEGMFFQLASDIDLGNNEWTPIGTTSNSFRGIFDGAGHTIAYGIVTVSEIPEENIYDSYGLFGSVGGGNSKSYIMNLELFEFDISITADGSTATSSGWWSTQGDAGMRIGCLAGTLYQNSNIENVIVSSSTISDVNEMEIYNYQFQFAVGGVAGYVTNSSTSDADPGAANRYVITNCYSNVVIDLDATARVTNGWGASDGRGQYHTGGIIGTIRAQQVWPTNCLYNGTITSNGYIGPLFGALINRTSYTTMNQTLWNGNDAGNLTANNAYYTNYSANGTRFTSTVTSGNSTSRVSNNNSNVGYVQGVNKGIYTTDMTMILDMFNGNITTDNKYLTWIYENNSFTFKERLTTDYIEPVTHTYQITVNDPYQVGSYNMVWFRNGVEDASIQSDRYVWTPNYDEDEDIMVLTYDGSYYAITKFTIKKIGVDIVFNVDKNNDKVTASLEGEGMLYTTVDDYTFQWYMYDISGEGDAIQNANSLVLENLEDGMDYRLVATNNVIPQLSTENTFTYGDRLVIFVDYNNGNNNRDGYTPETAVKTLPTAYGKLNTGGTISTNVIVIMGNYTARDVFYNTKDSNNTSYQKNATITGKYAGVDYDGTLYMYYSTNAYNFINGDTNFQNLTFNGNNGQAYLYAQGHNLTMGKGLYMENYAVANTNQGLITGNSPAFHVLGGYLQYNRRTLPRNNGKIIIKSGAYGRVLGGGGSGTSAGVGQTTSHDFTGSNLTDDTYTATILVDIQESTKGNYTYDINLLVGGSTAGNMYANITINVKNGSVGRLLGGSIGDRVSMNNWNYPENTFLGYTTINLTGGTIQELYGGSLGRNMNAIGGSGNARNLICDIYFYGTININISGSTIVNSNIYGAGAGGVTGYHANSTDTYKSYGQNVPTNVNINITGGTINGNIYGGGYGYTEYLTENVTARDGGALYGDSNIVIDQSPTIRGNIYAAGCGYDFNNKTELAQMYGTSNILIKGTPIIEGQIFGAGQGISGLENMAKFTGTSNVTIETDLSLEVYGAGNISKSEGETNINIVSGTHTGDIYGGGNLGLLDGTSNININGGTNTRIFGGGNQATVTNTIVNINGGDSSDVYGGGNLAETEQSEIFINSGNATNVYAGGNQAGVNTTNVLAKGGNITYLYGGSNTTGDVTTSNIEIKGGNFSDIYGGNNQGGETETTNIDISGGNTQNIYGGGNQAETETTNIQLRGGSITNVYGGGNLAGVTTSNITTYGGHIKNIYGGGNQAGVDVTNVITNGGNIGNLFGGSNRSGDVNESHITTNDAPDSEQNGTLSVNITTPTIKNTEAWQNTTYPTYARLQVELINETDKDINEWNLDLVINDSILASNYSSSEIFVNNGIFSLTEINRYYGTNVISKGGKYTFEFEIFSMQSVEEFEVNYSLSGINSDGNIVNSTISNIETVYGGNNQGGTTITPTITIYGGGVENVYGGGNQAVSNVTNVYVYGIVEKNIYGGGNQAAINTNTNVYLTGAYVGDNVYGGGNQGTVTGNTNVYVKNSTLKNSLYAGGNGISAVVYGDANLVMEGTSNQVENNVFGGGNQAATGTEEENSSQSIVNIVGGTIGGNVYGGANTSVVYGTTQTNIGYDAVGNSDLEIGDINIAGTVFGGGEANASGSEVYDFTFISVTVGIDIQIDGNGHNNFAILGSIFGSGNASSTSGTSNIMIKNYGTFDNPQKNVSLQRTDCATIINSALSLSGATDRTNEYSGTFFSISRVDRIKLKNNSTLFLCNGANLLTQLDSLVDIDGEEVKGSVEINTETNEITKNVDNRVYMLEGKNLNVALNEKATLYGKVQGMFFFGLFTNRNNPSTSTGLYHKGNDDGEEILNPGTFVSNSYVMAEHLTNPEHDIKVDGFYTNYNEEGIVNVDYIIPTPEADIYYMWLAGEEMEVKVFNIDMVASKYATLGTYELALAGFADPNIKFTIAGFSSGLINEVSLVDPTTIPSIESDEGKANSQFGLTMKTGNIGWMTKGETKFFTQNGGSYDGLKNYASDNTTFTPTLNFCFYHSQNLTKKQALGDVKIRFQVMTPIDDLNYKISYIDINITLSTALFQDIYYEAAITPGQEFGLFTTTDTTITTTSTFSTYYALLLTDFSNSDYYQNFENYNRVLVSRDVNNEPYVFPENTKLTMLDMVTNTYYYYIVTEDDVNNGKYVYSLSDFITMGSIDKKFNESEAYNTYHNQEENLIYENFIFHVNISDANITENIEQNSLLIELRDDDDQVILGVLGIQRENIIYTVFLDKEATIEVDATATPSEIYLGKPINLNVTTRFTQQIHGTKTIYDTQYFDQKLGIKISIYDSNGNRLNSDSLLGINFELDGILYYPRIDGTTRICIANKVTDVLAKLKINTENNTVLATDDYKIRIESFGSSDGIYYGLESSDMTEVDIKIINFAYGLKVASSNYGKIIDNETGNAANGNNSIAISLKYSSSLNNPSIAVSLYRRKYTDVFSTEYELVDLSNYVSTQLTPTTRDKEYVVSTNPLASSTQFLLMKPNLMTGTYKLVYKLYDGNTYVGEVYEYMIIK